MALRINLFLPQGALPISWPNFMTTILVMTLAFTHGDFLGEQESDVAPPDPALNEDAQPSVELPSNHNKLICGDKSHAVVSLPVTSKNAPTNKTQHAAKHTIILDRMNSIWAMHSTKHKVSDYSSIKTGTLVECGATDGDAGFGIVHLKTGERFADINGIHDG